MRVQLFYVTLIIISIFSCSTDSTENGANNPPNNSINKIMPLGASRVEGNRPEFESYRYELWKDLKDNGWTFDFVGTRMDEASYPSFNGFNFDNDHEGRGGWTSGQILSNLISWLNQTGAPDIVLFSSPGGNDALLNLSYDQAITNINAIIDILQQANSNVVILIEQMAPGRSDIMTMELTNYFNQIQQDVLNIAAQKTTMTSQVIPVDMSTGFSDALLVDDVHYNAAGADFIATRYYDVLINILQTE